MNPLDECLLVASIICGILSLAVLTSCICICKNGRNIPIIPLGYTRHIDFLVEKLNEFKHLSDADIINSVGLAREHRQILIEKIECIKIDLLDKIP